MTGLAEGDVDADPFRQFSLWHAEAGSPAEVAVATGSGDAAPSVRMVLLRGLDGRGFMFFTNRDSAKARDMADNPRAALLFFWAPDRQVRVQGAVEQTTDEESDAYWRTRARGSQLGAWASAQSAVLDGRAELEARLADVTARFPGEVPRPPFWGGYRVVPASIELWQRRDDRLHDRLRYRRDGERWVIERLSP